MASQYPAEFLRIGHERGRIGVGYFADLALLRDHRQRVLAQLAETQDHLGAIDRKIGIYVDRLEQLPQRGLT